MPRTISDNLIRLEQAKTDIGTAINSYGFDTPSNSTLTTYPTTINTIGTDINGTLETCLGTGSGHSIVIDKTITANGVYSPLDDNAYAYDEVTVNVANSYGESDEGKVVNNGALVSQTAYPTTITENGTYNTTENNSVTVDVPTSNYMIVPCNYDASITDETYYKDTPQLIIDTVNKTVQLIVNFHRKTGYSSVGVNLTPTIPLSEIFDSQTVFTMQYQAIGTNQSTSGGGSYYRTASAQTTNQYFIIDILNNTITKNTSMSLYTYGGITGYIKWTYQ